MGCSSSKSSDSTKENKPTEKPPAKMGLDQSVAAAAALVASGLPPPPPARKFSDFYAMGEPLGQGSFSVVKIATNMKTREKVAVKIVNRQKLHPKDVEAFLQEMEILRTLDHPNIVKMHDFFEEPTLYYLVLEYVGGGELFERLLEKALYTERDARDVAETMFKALKYVHDKGLVHRDVKPENILLVSREDDTQIKLADFGFCVDSSVSTTQVSQTVGTPGYVSPEVIQHKPHGPPVDMWAMGVVLYMLLGGYPPFYEPNDDRSDVFRRILAVKYEFHPDSWSTVTEEAKDLIRKLLVADPRQRLTAEQALAHPWIRKPEDEFALVPLERTLILMKDFRAAKARYTAAMASVAIDAIRLMSGANLGKAVNLNDVAIDVMRKISGTNLNAEMIEAARRNSRVNMKTMGERIEANRTRSAASLKGAGLSSTASAASVSSNSSAAAGNLHDKGRRGGAK